MNEKLLLKIFLHDFKNKNKNSYINYYTSTYFLKLEI